MRIGVSGGVAVGSVSVSGGAQTELGNPLAEIGRQASRVVDGGLAAGAQAAQTAGDKIQHLAREAAQEIRGRSAAALDGAAAYLQDAAARLPRMDLQALRGKMALPHVPPPPRLEAALAVDLDRLHGRFHVHNGGWPSVSVQLDGVKLDGSFTLRGGSLGASVRAELSDTLRAVFSAPAGALGLAQLGFDLVGRCAAQPLLSAALAQLPRGLAMLLRARHEVHGGFRHLDNLFQNLFGGLETKPFFRQGMPGQLHPGTANAPAKPGDDLTSILHNPALSFEEKMFMFCLGIAKRQEDEIKRLMDGWQAAKTNAKAAGTANGAKAPEAGGGPPGMPGLPGLPAPGGMQLPDFSQVGSAVGGIVGTARQAGSGFLKMAGMTAPLWVPALVSAASAVAAAIPPPAGATISAGLATVGNLATPLVVGAACGLGSAALDAVPLEKLAQGAIQQAGQGAPGLSGPVAKPGAGGGGGLNPLTGALIGGGLGLLSNPVYGPLVAPFTALLGFGVGGLASGGQNAMMGGLAGGALGLLSNPLYGPLLAPFTAAAGAGLGGMAGAGAAPGGAPAAGGSAAGSGTSVTTEDGQTFDATEKDSENHFMQKLSFMQQQMSKTYEMCSNMTKAMHDTQMSAIRNMR